MTLQDRIAPHSIDAEEAILGAALLAPQAMEILVAELESADFYKPAHQAIHSAIRRMWDQGERRCDSTSVADELKQSADLDAVGGASSLISLVANTPATSNADRYARIIQEKSLLRRMVRAGEQIHNLGLDDSTANDPADAIARARMLVEDLELPIGAVDPSPSVDEFLALETTTDWLVPGLLERGDRVMLTSPEGGGKSTLIRQLAVQLSSGYHPWKSSFITPIKVLIIDVENSVPQVQRNLRALTIKAGENLVRENLRIEVRTQGLDLTNRRDVRWLIERVASARPDLVTIGPIYKLHEDDPNDEKPARKVAQALDDIRSRYGCALLIEAHSPHGSGSKRPLRPFGASLWMRWPEFGYGLRRTKTDPNQFIFEEWRGPRDVRDWPQRLRRGGEWPWTPVEQQTRMSL